MYLDAARPRVPVKVTQGLSLLQLLEGQPTQVQLIGFVVEADVLPAAPRGQLLRNEELLSHGEGPIHRFEVVNRQGDDPNRVGLQGGWMRGPFVPGSMLRQAPCIRVEVDVPFVVQVSDHDEAIAEPPEFADARSTILHAVAFDVILQIDIAQHAQFLLKCLGERSPMCQHCRGIS